MSRHVLLRRERLLALVTAKRFLFLMNGDNVTVELERRAKTLLANVAEEAADLLVHRDDVGLQVPEVRELCVADGTLERLLVVVDGGLVVLKFVLADERFAAGLAFE